MQQLAEYFAGTGLLARHWPGFEARGGQLRLAEAIAAALAGQDVLLAEAATGTGKTLAYLLPLLLSGKTALISTGTRNLQEQLFFRDLPAIRKILNVDLRCSLLKGRANYLCHYRLQQAQGLPQLRGLAMQQQLARVKQWSRSTKSGDLSELSSLPEDAGIRNWVTSTTENCLGSECPMYDDCHVYKAREQARKSDVVVVNHHLLFADLALREQGFGEVLPAMDAVIVDEAHQVPAVASAFFGSSLSHRQLTELISDARVEAAQQSGALAMLQADLEQLQYAQRELLLALSGVEQRQTMSKLLQTLNAAVISDLEAALTGLGLRIQAMSERSKGLQQINDRLQQLQTTLELCLHGDQKYVCWFEPRQRGFAMHATPLEIDEMFARIRASMHTAWIFTSATLTVGGDFSYFARRLGLQQAQTISVESPFDYDRNTMLWIPRDLPAPGGGEHTQKLLQAVLPVLKANHGRAFLLFTTHRALRQAARWLQANSSFKLQVQGEAPRAVLLQRFRDENTSLLLGAASFWEGVDVAGADLSIVIIDKLPFAAPDDPVYQARADAITAQGGSAFTGLSLPEAILALKQGVGRLIRHQHDYGLVVLGDNRLQSKGYGQLFLRSLPVQRSCNSASEAIAFLRSQTRRRA